MTSFLSSLNLPLIEEYSSQALIKALSSESSHSNFAYELDSLEASDYDNEELNTNQKGESDELLDENETSTNEKSIKPNIENIKNNIVRNKNEKKILLLQSNFLSHASRLLRSEQIAELSVVESYDLDEVMEIGLPPKSRKKGYREADGNVRVIPPDYDCIHFICQPDLKLLKHVINLSSDLRAKEKKSKKGTKQIRLVLNVFPRITYIAQKLIDKYQDLDIELKDLHIDLLCLENDLLSMELNNCFRQCHLDGDFSSIYFIARSIMKLQSIYGIIPHVRGKGYMSTAIMKMVQRMQRAVSNVVNIPSSIHTLILIDRTVDLLTPLQTQLNYEGLIDECFGINNGLFEPNFTPCIPGNRKIVALDDGDRIFSEIRNCNIRFVGSKLKQKAKQIGDLMKMRESLQNASISEIANFTKRLPQISEDKLNLEMHINIVHKLNSIIGTKAFQEKIKGESDAIRISKQHGIALKFAEESIIKQEPLTKPLRILCLVSIISNGLSLREYQHFRSEIVQSYGLHATLTLNNLHELGLFTYKDSSTSKNINWSSIFRDFEVIRDVSNQNDMYSVFGSYSPISIKVIQSLLMKERTSKMDLLPGALDMYDQKVKMKTNMKVCLVYFVGGVTRGEINTLRTLNATRKENDPIYLIATTNLMNGYDFVRQGFTKDSLKLDQFSQNSI